MHIIYTYSCVYMYMYIYIYLSPSMGRTVYLTYNIYPTKNQLNVAVNLPYKDSIYLPCIIYILTLKCLLYIIFKWCCIYRGQILSSCFFLFSGWWLGGVEFARFVYYIYPDLIYIYILICFFGLQGGDVLADKLKSMTREFNKWCQSHKIRPVGHITTIF